MCEIPLASKGSWKAFPKVSRLTFKVWMKRGSLWGKEISENQAESLPVEDVSAWFWGRAFFLWTLRAIHPLQGLLLTLPEGRFLSNAYLMCINPNNERGVCACMCVRAHALSCYALLLKRFLLVTQLMFLIFLLFLSDHCLERLSTNNICLFK